MQEDEQYDMDKLFQKQIKIRQLMNLKTKGRFLEETKIFEKQQKQVPSVKSQRKTVSASSILMPSIDDTARISEGGRQR